MTFCTVLFSCASKFARDWRTPRWAMMIGARLAKKPKPRSSGWESENVSPELNDGFTVAKLLLVVKRVVAKPTLRLVPVVNCCEYPAVVDWLSVLRVDAPLSDESLGETERVGANPATSTG